MSIIVKIIDRIKKIFEKKRFLHTNKFISKDIILRNSKMMSIGSGCCIGEKSYLLCWDKYQHGKVNQSLNSKLIIGDNFRATRFLTIQCCNDIRIGNNVLVASNVFIIDYNHGSSKIDIPYLENELELQKVVISDNVWIGQGVYILPGVEIGKNSIIGAGAVVTKSIPEYSIAVGNPAKVIKKYNFETEKWENVK